MAVLETFKLFRGDTANLKKHIGFKINGFKVEASQSDWEGTYLKNGMLKENILAAPYSFEYIVVVLREG